MSHGKKKSAGQTLSPDIQAIIKKAVEDAIQAGKAAQKAEALEPYKQTERRLYALPHLEEKIAADKGNLEFYNGGNGITGSQGTSKSIVRFERSGYRVSQEDIQAAMVKDLESRISADEEEVQTVRAALSAILADYYYPAVDGKYFQGKDDDTIGGELACDTSTVRRNRGRLVRIVAIRLYGVAAT